MLFKRKKIQLSREEKAFIAINKNGTGLEIGPSHNPLAPKKLGYDVKILDHASAEELKKKYMDCDVKIENIEEVDYIWQGERFTDLIGKTEIFDWIIASHVIEHVPDFISFLKQCEGILKPNGILSLIIPDKRFCFDYFLPNSTTGQILDAWHQENKKPTPGQIFDFFANISKNSNQPAWNAKTHKIPNSLFNPTLDKATKLWIKAQDNSEYTDVHCWRFTPESFNIILNDLFSLELLNFEIKHKFETSGSEFHVSLSKTTNSTPFIENRLSNLVQLDQELKQMK